MVFYFVDYCSGLLNHIAFNYLWLLLLLLSRTWFYERLRPDVRAHTPTLRFVSINYHGGLWNPFFTTRYVTHSFFLLMVSRNCQEEPEPEPDINEASSDRTFRVNLKSQHGPKFEKIL